MNIKFLQQFSTRFYTKCADLKNDMGKRIMYSIIPHLADASQIALTEGVVDYKALKSAVDGRHKLIEYGTRATVDELEHYKVKKPHYEALSWLDVQEFERAMDVAVKTYQDDEGWVSGFGGKLWEQIARTLRQIIRLDKTLNKIRATSPVDKTAELQIMRDLVVEMNVFDGLSHNSASVMRNLVEIETNKQYESRGQVFPNHKELYKARKQEEKEQYRQIKRMMDAKELENPAEVFKLVQPTLEGSGDINQFKDWVSRMRRSDDFRKSDPNIGLKLFWIYIRKEIMPLRSDYNRMRDRLSKKIEQLEQRWDDNLGNDLLHSLDNATYETHIISQELEEFIKTFLYHYPEFTELESTFKQMLSKQVAQGLAIHSALTTMQPPPIMNASQKDQASYIASFKQMMSLLHKLSYILDEI